MDAVVLFTVFFDNCPAYPGKLRVIASPEPIVHNEAVSGSDSWMSGLSFSSKLLPVS